MSDKCFFYVPEEFLAADIKLYHHFKQKFHKKLKTFGKEKMKEKMLKHEQNNLQIKVMYFYFKVIGCPYVCLKKSGNLRIRKK